MAELYSPSAPELRSFVEFSLGGRMFTEYQQQRVDSRDPRAAIAMMPREAFAFRFYDEYVSVVRDGVDYQTVRSRRLNVSGFYFVDGELFDLEGVEALGESHSILATNMRCNGWSRVVRARAGNFQPFDVERDVIAHSKGGV